MQTTTTTTTNTTTTLKLVRYEVAVSYQEPGRARRYLGAQTIAAIDSTDASKICYRLLDEAIRSRCEVTTTVRHPATGTWICDSHYRPCVQKCS
jgi:hypothetical protein